MGIGAKGKGKRELKEAIRTTYRNIDSTSFRLDYGEALEPVLISLENELKKYSDLSDSYPRRWLVVKLMENDSEARKFVERAMVKKEGGLK